MGWIQKFKEFIFQADNSYNPVPKLRIKDTYFNKDYELKFERNPDNPEDLSVILVPLV